MEVIKTRIPDLKIIIPDVHGDERGWFVETYNLSRYVDLGLPVFNAQDNMSLSMKGVVRGLHWQDTPKTQAKLVHVIRGAVMDVAVDIRKGSPTFGQYVSVELTGENFFQFYIPRGFAHGFVTLEDNTVFAYKCDNLYSPASERGLLFTDPALGIRMPSLGIGLTFSEKDKKFPLLSEIKPWEPKENKYDIELNESIVNAPNKLSGWTSNTTQKLCPRCKSTKDGCEFFDNGICRGVVYTTYPPQYDPCVF